MWVYVIDRGWLVSPAGVKVAQGYSGAPEAKDDPYKTNLKDIGPCPVGLYTIGQMQETKDHGPDAMPLIADPENEMFGRSGFWMHGDSIHAPGTASEGCIIQPRFARDRVAQSSDKRLQVVATLDTEDSKWPNAD